MTAVAILIPGAAWGEPETPKPMAQLLRALTQVPPHQIGDVPWHCMATLIGDARRVRERHEAELLAAGWSVVEIYGADPIAPWARLDKAGIVWLLHDHKILSITSEAVVIETFTGARQTFRRLR